MKSENIKESLRTLDQLCITIDCLELEVDNMVLFGKNVKQTMTDHNDDFIMVLPFSQSIDDTS